MIKILKPSKLSIKLPQGEEVRFAIEYEGSLSNTNRLKNFKNFVNRQDPKRISFIVSKNSSYYEPGGALKKEIRSSDPQADKFLNIFITDNKKATPKKVYFFREDGTEVSIFSPITKAIKKGTQSIEKIEKASNNYVIIALILGGITLAVLSSKTKKR